MAHRAFFQLLVDHVGDAVFMVDADGIIGSWTPAAVRIFGYTAEQAVGRSLDALYPSDHRPSWRDELNEALQTGRSEHDGPRRRSDGSTFWAHTVIAPIREEGTLHGFGLIVRNNSAERAREQASAHHALDLERSNRELVQFAGVASHDLQEPLRKILSFADRLRARTAGQIDERSTDYLARIVDSTLRMKQLVNDLLAYAQLGHQGTIRPVDLSAIARDVVSDLAVGIERNGASVEIGPLPTIEAEPSQIRQLLQNLIANALKFQNGRVPPRVTVSAERQGDTWQISIADNGIGFDEKYRDRMFGMLQRLHGRDEFAGTGMGLAICARIVERHRGHITARGTPGSGSTFVVTLPAMDRREEPS